MVLTVESSRSSVHHNVAVFVFDSETSSRVARFLPAVVVHGLHSPVGVLPPLVVGSVDLPLACVEVDLLGAVPGRPLIRLKQVENINIRMCLSVRKEAGLTG